MKQNDLMSRKQKHFCKTFVYIEHFLILDSANILCFRISAFASLISIPIGITSSAIVLKSCSAIGLNICVTSARIKKCKSVIKKKKKKHDKMLFLAKSKLNSI